MGLTSSFRASRRSSPLQLLKSAVATVAAWLVAGWLVPGPLPVFAAIAALLVVQPSLNQSFSKAAERTVGVILGVSVAGVLGLVFGGGTWVIILSMLVAFVVAWALRMTPGTTNQVVISAMLVLALGSQTPGYAFDRVIETLLGAVIGFVVNYAIVPPTAVSPARLGIHRLGSDLAEVLDRLASALRHPQSADDLGELIATARRLRSVQDTVEGRIRAAADSLALNPRAGRHREVLAELRRLLDRFTPVVIQTIGMTRTFYDSYDDSLRDEPALVDIAEQLERAAHDVRLLVHDLGAGAGAPPGEPDRPALTRELTLAAPKSGHWVLVGSLLVDLHRIHGTLTAETV